jgi:hypothetical protein
MIPYCAQCNTSLKLAGTPPNGLGKLATGQLICTDCYDQALAKNPQAVINNLSLFAVRALILGTPPGVAPDTDYLFKQLDQEVLDKMHQPDEQLFAMVSGYNTGGFGILAATNQRLFFIRKGSKDTLIKDLGVHQPDSLKYEAGGMFATISIVSGDSVVKITNVDNELARAFCSKAKARLQASQKSPAVPPTLIIQAPQPIDLATQIERLAALKERGLLTQEEFEMQKKRLLGL